MHSHQPSLTFGQQLLVLRSSNDGNAPSNIATDLGVDTCQVESVLQRRPRLERAHTRVAKRRHLPLADKLLVLHFSELNWKRGEICSYFDVHSRTVTRILRDKEKLLALDANRVPLTVQRKTYATYPAIDSEVQNFISFARSERLPVSFRMIQDRALLAAQRLGIPNFKASPGWIQRFLRRSPIQPSFRLHGKGSSSLPERHAEQMQQLQLIAADYDASNIYNVDESGLFYRMGPNRTYLTASENRAAVRGTDFLKHKSRVTIVLSCNSDGSHILPPCYIGNAETPRCFRGGAYSHVQQRYWAQANAWMDSKGFRTWLEWWHSQVKERSEGPWLLIMDNCGGHESSVDIPGLRIAFLPPRSTAKYQPLDLGLIGNSKVRYRSNLLRMTLNVLLQRCQPATDTSPFPASNDRGRLGLKHGFLPHVGDAIDLYDESWSATTRESVVRCWMKSSCLPDIHMSSLRAILTDSGQSTARAPIGDTEAGFIRRDLAAWSALECTTTPLTEILGEANAVADAARFVAMINSPAPFDVDPTPHEVAEEQLQSRFETYRANTPAPTPPTPPPANNNWSNAVVQLSELQNSLPDDDITADLLEQLRSRAQQLAA